MNDIARIVDLIDEKLSTLNHNLIQFMSKIKNLDEVNSSKFYNLQQIINQFNETK